MRTFIRTSAVLAAMLFPSHVSAAPTSRDFQPLTEREAAMFFPLACNHPNRSVALPYKTGGVVHDRCAKLGRDSFERQIASKVLYGSFTRKGADEALLIYSDSYYVRGVGRVLLFARSNGQWKLIQWNAAPWLECTAIPRTAPQRLLCLYGYTEQGMATEWFSVFQVTPPGSKISVTFPKMLFHKDYHSYSYGGMSKEVIKTNELGCNTGVIPKGEAYLVWLHSLHSSSADPYFAVANATYETSEDIASACATPNPREVREATGEIRFRVVAGKVTAVSPVQFANSMTIP